jgi:glycosyltransferase involved in cell wall biosynthesis
MGGVCQAVRTIIAGLTDLGVHNEVVSLDPSDAPFLQNDPFAVHALGLGKGPWGYNPQLVPWLVEHLPRFDAVVVHGLWLFYGHAVRRAQRQLQARRTPGQALPKVFVMPHGMLDPYFQRAAGRRLKAIRNTLYWKLIEQQLLNNADALLFTCEEERRLAAEPFRPFRPRRTVVVGLGVEEPPQPQAAMQQALRAACPELQDEPYILFLSRIHEKKGVDLLLNAYEAASQRVPALAAVGAGVAEEEPALVAKLPRLLVVGPGLDTPYGQRMQALVAGSPVLREAVLFPGMLTGDAKWGAFHGCEAFILPSHQENFGIAVVEALACGKPVLISDQVNIWREIEAAGGGVVRPDTAAGTHELLAHWQQLSAAAKNDFQQQARQTFESEFAVRPAAVRFLQAIQ